MTTAGEIVADARTWIGTPMLHAGRNRQGLDCVGLLVMVLHDLGISDWDDRQYSRVVNPERMVREIELFCDPVWRRADGAAGDPRAAMRTGDVLHFEIQRYEQHCGIYAGGPGNGTLIHAYESVGKVVEHELTEKWARRIVGVYRFRAIGA